MLKGSTVQYIVEKLIWINFGWYVLLAIGFAVAGSYPKALYFLGASILTIGVILM